MTDILARLRAAVAGRYTIERELGRAWTTAHIMHKGGHVGTEHPGSA